MKPSSFLPHGITRLEVALLISVPVVLLMGGVLLLQAILIEHGQNPIRSAVNQRSIVMSAISYAKDHAGRFPAENSAGIPFANSTEAFQYLMEYDGLKDTYFYAPGNPLKRRGPNEDGTLTVQENTVVYVTGQNDMMHSDSPLTANEMEQPGIYGRNHLWLKHPCAVVGYLGGHSKVEKLSQKTPGATVLGPPGSGIRDIFQLRDRPIAPGLMDVPRDHILLP